MDFGPKVIVGLFLYKDFWKVIFWLVVKLEISYRVTSGYPWPSDTMKSPKSGGGGSKKRQNYQIYLVGFECVVKDLKAWLQLFTSFPAL